MMKRIWISCLALVCAMGAWGQKGANTEIAVPADSKMIFHAVNVPVQTADNPFLTVAVRLEGAEITKNLASLILNYDVDGEQKNITFERYHDSDGDPDVFWVSNLAFLPANAQIRYVNLNVKRDFLTHQIRKISVRVFAPSNIQVDPVDTGGRAKNTCSRPTSVSRSVWGSAWGLTDDRIHVGTPTITTVTHLMVHHGASSNTATNYPAVVASYFDYHINSNGWSDIGYNWLIAPDGTLFVGRGGGDNVQGAHFCGRNANSMGICLVGDYTATAPSAAMQNTLVGILAWKASQRGINPTGSSVHYSTNLSHISGHRDGCATACPGDSAYVLLPSVRQRVAAQVAQCATRAIDFESVASTQILPNPVQNNQFQLNVKLKNVQPIDVKIMNANGQMIVNQLFVPTDTQFQTTISTQNWASGTYFAYIVVGDKFTTEKIVVTK